MRVVSLAISISLIFLIGLSPAPAASGNVPVPWQEKVDRQLLIYPSDGESEFIIYLTEQADLSGAENLKSKQEKGQYVYRQLISATRRSQRPVLQLLSNMGAEFQSFWVANMIWVRGDGDVLHAMAARGDVEYIYANPQVKMPDPGWGFSEDLLQTADIPEWNVSKIRAPEVWSAGFSGQGITIGGQDTGYDWDHPALKSQYRGWDGASVDHNYNWHDAIHSSLGNPCGSDAQEPCDDHYLGHGTHTMGTMVGREDDLTNQIGVAPEANWIGCRNMDQGVGSPATYIECYQWFLAPTDLNNLNPDPTRAPDVINNSWSCPVSEGCTDPLVLLPVVEAVRAAGILTVHSAGNSGPSCASINTPAAIYEASFTVGNTDSFDQIAISSSRGPVTSDGSGRIKPDVSAPGTSIRSSVPGNGYRTLTGTSMAGPHVAGLAALLLSAQPDLIGQVEHTERLIANTAVPVSSTSQCGGIPDTIYPNNSSGYGRVDAMAAFQGQVMWLEKAASPNQVLPGEEILYMLSVHHSSVQSSATDILLSDEIPTDTTFLNATEPYTIDEWIVSWELPDLNSVDSQTVELRVHVVDDFIGTVTNNHYQVTSTEFQDLITGSAVKTQVIPRFRFLFPWIAYDK
jgi:subtilisin family serine protease